MRRKMKEEQIVEGQKLLTKIRDLRVEIDYLQDFINLKDNANPYSLGHVFHVGNVHVEYQDVKHLLDAALKKKTDELEVLKAELEKL